MSTINKYPCTHCDHTGYVNVFEKLPLENPTLGSGSDLKGACRVCRGAGYTYTPNDTTCYHEYIGKDFRFIEEYRALGIIYGYHTATCHKCKKTVKLLNDSIYAN